MDDVRNAAVLERITKLVYRSAVPGQVICLLTALVLAAAHYNHIDTRFLLLWITLTWGVAFWRLRCAQQYASRQPNTALDFAYWNRRFCTGVNVTAAVWGCGGFLLMHSAPDAIRLFTAFVLSGLVSGAVPILGAQYSALRNFAVLILTPVFLAALLGSGELDNVVAAMCFMYMVVVIKGVRHYNEAIVEGILLELEQKQLVAELEQARNTAEAASQAKTHFIANVSHEIRTPMNGIVGMAHVLAQSELSESQRRDLAVIQSSSDLLLALVNDVLDISKIESDQFELKKQNFNLIDLLQNTCDMFALAAKEKNIELLLKLPENTAALRYGDVTRLQQVLVNLVGNAVKFTAAGQVRLDCVAQADEVSISVSDTGIGITQERLPHIFDAFVQADGSLSRQYGGTGLGLTIARKLVNFLGGQLAVSSELGKGSQFFFKINLPVIAELSPASVAAAESSLPRLAILLAEDNPTNRLVATKILEAAGHTVLSAENGEQAVQMQLQHKFDLILMDMQMPIMDGLEATRLIRQQGSKIPIIALTANALEADRKACFQVGMNGFMTKPIRPEQLHAAIVSSLA